MTQCNPNASDKKPNHIHDDFEATTATFLDNSRLTERQKGYQSYLETL